MLHFEGAAGAQQRLEHFLAESFQPGTAIPFSFIYRGESSRRLLDGWRYERKEGEVAFHSPDGLVAAVEIRTFEDFPAVPVKQAPFPAPSSRTISGPGCRNIAPPLRL